MRIKWFLAAVLFLALPVGVDADESRQVDGARYDEEGGVWYQVDSFGERWEVCRGRLAARFDASFSPDSISTVFAGLGTFLRQTSPDVGGFYRFSYGGGLEPPDVLAAVLAMPHVERAYLDTYLKFFATANDSFYVNQWNILRARVDKAWDITAGSDGVTIAVIDRGIMFDHDDLEGAIWINPEEDINHNGIFDDFPASAGGDIDNIDNDPTPNPKVNKIDDVIGWDFTGDFPDTTIEDNDPRSQILDDGHGTLVAGIACALRNNGKGIAGVAGGNGLGGCRLMAIRLQTYEDASDAIEYAWRQGADVISMSWGMVGGGDPNGAVSTAIENAYAHGTVLLAATGNKGDFGPMFFAFPSTHSDVIAVGSSDENDVGILTSSYGPHVDLVAPSSSHNVVPPPPFIWSTDDYESARGWNPGYPGWYDFPPDNTKYCGKFSGTSAACPFAAGVAALVKSHLPALTNQQIRDRLLNSAIDVDSVGFDWKTGWGRVDAYRALTEWGTISGNVTWSPSDTHNGARYVSGDLTIAPGATLTIMPGTIIKVAADDDLGQGNDPIRVEIVVQGNLIADGTPGIPIVFQSWKTTTTPNWAGIRFEAGGTGTIDNCSIMHAVVGVGTSAGLEMSNTVIDSCLTGVLASGGTVTLQDCELTHAEVGARFDNSSAAGTLNNCVVRRAEYGIDTYVPVTVRQTDIDSCSYAGIVARNGGVFVKDSNVTHSGTFGVSLTGSANVIRGTLIDVASSAGLDVHADASLTLRGSTLQNCGTGLYVNGNAAVDVDSTCYVWMNDTGIHFYNAGSSSTIKRTGITWNASVAILCDNSSPRIELLTIAHNGSGIYCSNSASPIIESNKIQTSGVAVTALSASHPDLGHSEPPGGQASWHNQIAFTDKYVANYTDSTIYAQYNCWNTTVDPCNPASNKFIGAVDHTHPTCPCSFPLFPRGEGEPEPSESIVVLPPQDAFQLARKTAATGLVAIVPNPFNPTTTVHYSLATRGKVEINVYDVTGKLVQVLANETQSAGPHAAVWNGTDRRGSPVASGIYFVRMAAANQVFTRKMVLLK